MKKVLIFSILLLTTGNSFITNAAAPWAKQTYISKDINIHHNQRGQSLQVSDHLSLQPGDYVEYLVVIAASKRGNGQMALLRNGERIAVESKINRTIDVLKFPLKTVLRRGETLEIITAEDIQISSIGAVVEIVAGFAQPLPATPNPIRLDGNCQWSDFHPQFQAGLNVPTMQSRKSQNGHYRCQNEEKRAMTNCYSYSLTATNATVGARFHGASTNNKKNHIRTINNTAGNVCLDPNESKITLQKLLNVDGITRLVLTEINSGNIVFDETFGKSDKGDLFLNSWYRKDYQLVR